MPQRAVPAYRAIAARTPTLAIWGDWDYAGNNSDGTEPGKARSLLTFKQLWPNPSFGHADEPGIYFKFSWGDVGFFILDGLGKDGAEAARWFSKAANQGHTGAQRILGGMYENGRGVAKDQAQVDRWYRKAAGKSYSAEKYPAIPHDWIDESATAHGKTLCAARTAI